MEQRVKCKECQCWFPRSVVYSWSMFNSDEVHYTCQTCGDELEKKKPKLTNWEGDVQPGSLLYGSLTAKTECDCACHRDASIACFKCLYGLNCTGKV